MSLFGLFGTKKSTPNVPDADELFTKGKECEKQNPSQAFAYFSKAAEMGHTGAMNKMGHCYLYKGRGAEFDIVQSAYWFEKGANAGDPKCMCMLAQFYMSGIGRRENDSKAKSLLSRAAEAPDEKLASIAKRWLDNYPATKISVTAVMTTAVDFGGIPK